MISGSRTSRHRRPWLVLLFALFALFALVGAGRPAAAAAEPALSGPAHGVRGQSWIASDHATLADARAAFAGGAGRAADEREVMPLGPGAAVWYRLEFPAVAQPTRAVLRVTFSGTDSVELFRPDGAGGWSAQRSGDAVANRDWPVRHLDPAFLFTLQPGEDGTYLRVRNAQPIRVRLALQTAASFMESLKSWHFALGAYAGFIAMVVLVSLFNTVSWRDPIHLYYAVHVVLVALSVMALTGLAGEYLWPAHAWWNDKAPVVIPALSIGWAGLLLRELVAERGRRLVSWLLVAHAISFVLMVAAFLVLGRENVYRAPSVFAAPGLALLIGVVGWYSRRHPPVGLWVLAGMALLALGAVLPLLANLGLLQPSVLTEHGPQIGSALEIPLVLIGLFFRSKERRANRQQLQALAHTDPLTGLANHRVLAARLQQLLRQSRRDPLAGAVLRVHVANLNDIRAEHGREAGEAALMRAGECVAREAREGDLVAREHGDDLVLVLGGQPTQGQAAVAGRNIIARGLKFSGRLPPGTTLKLLVAGISPPLPQADAAGLLQTLARLLLDIENDPHGRALRFVGAADSSPWQRSGVPPRVSELPAGAPADEASKTSARPRRTASTH